MKKSFHNVVFAYQTIKQGTVTPRQGSKSHAIQAAILLNMREFIITPHTQTAQRGRVGCGKIVSSYIDLSPIYNPNVTQLLPFTYRSEK